MKAAVILGTVGAVALGGVIYAVATRTPSKGTTTTIKARDGSSHRLEFRQVGAGHAWVALSTDTANRFQQGERVKISGRTYAWQAGLNAFVEVP